MSSGSLPVRFFLFRDILDDDSSEDYNALKRNLRKHKPRRSLLARQNAEGLWPLEMSTKGLAPQQVQTLQILQQLEKLHELVDLGITRKQEKVQSQLVYLIRKMDKDGRLPGRFYHHAQAVYLFIVLGLEGNEHADKAIHYLLDAQQPNGAWSTDHPGESDDQSCLWTTMFILWALTQSSKLRHRQEVTEGIDYLVTNILAPDQSSILPGIQAWDQFYTGYSGQAMLHGGTLRLLETLAMAEWPIDRKIRKLLDWLEAQQLRNGHWPSIAGRDRRGDEAVTLRVLRVFKYYAKHRFVDEWIEED